jgi:hypothetical protein
MEAFEWKTFYGISHGITLAFVNRVTTIRDHLNLENICVQDYEN